jgi:predicted helicase
MVPVHRTGGGQDAVAGGRAGRTRGTGIPPAVFAYRLGNRSALEWVIDQYRVTTGARSVLRHDPTAPAHPQALVDLVQRVVRVSPAAQALIAALPPPA